jgi:TIR domain
MKVFISWSGDKSRSVALALADWLPGVINSVAPFVSAKDIYAGSRWQFEIATELDETNFGIVCVTKDNQLSSWLNFEAGALAKAVDSSRVVPLAIDLKPSDVQIPLGQFQAQPATREGIEAIVKSLNNASPSPLDEALLARAFATWWPQLESQLSEIDARAAPSGAPVRTDRELLEETLNTVRGLAASSAVSPPRVAPLRDHPVLIELTALLDDHGIDASVMPHNRERRVGIRPRTPRTVPDDVQELLRSCARSHDAEVEFLESRIQHPKAEERQGAAEAGEAIGHDDETS